MKAMGFIMMADLYGEMPYTEAVSADFTPPYDNGDVIYEGCLADLDRAIELFSAPQGAQPSPWPPVTSGARATPRSGSNSPMA